jgi:hypothetical protein
MIMIIGYYAIRTRHAATMAISEQSRFDYLWSSEKLSISAIQRTSMPSADDRRSIENLYRQAVIAYLQGDYERVTKGWHLYLEIGLYSRPKVGSGESA